MPSLSLIYLLQRTTGWNIERSQFNGRFQDYFNTKCGNRFIGKPLTYKHSIKSVIHLYLSTYLYMYLQIYLCIYICGQSVHWGSMSGLSQNVAQSTIPA